jgi:hypothetical protein
MGRRGMHAGILVGNPERIYHWEDLDAGGRIILKLILEK